MAMTALDLRGIIEFHPKITQSLPSHCRRPSMFRINADRIVQNAERGSQLTLQSTRLRPCLKLTCEQSQRVLFHQVLNYLVCRPQRDRLFSAQPTSIPSHVTNAASQRDPLRYQ